MSRGTPQVAIPGQGSDESMGMNVAERAGSLCAPLDANTPPRLSCWDVAKDTLLSFLVGVLLFVAVALLKERALDENLEGPASTFYEEF